MSVPRPAVIPPRMARPENHHRGRRRPAPSAPARTGRSPAEPAGSSERVPAQPPGNVHSSFSTPCRAIGRPRHRRGTFRPRRRSDSSRSPRQGGEESRRGDTTGPGIRSRSPGKGPSPRGPGGIVIVVSVRPFHLADIARPERLQRSIGRPQPGIGRDEDHGMNRDCAEDAGDELETPSHYLSFPRP